ncbi:MAG TPA: LPS export ABC transporter periplasmic protein LptC [Gammaproteobacteria bacterium]|nr:LPS export ABC transporter periplasmic protein LptC [Gammaproteobacteria bacterium]
MKLWLTLLLLAVLAGATTWLLRQINPAAQPPAEAASHAPDYYFEGATLTQLNTNGELESRLLSELITHHPDDGSVELTAPRFTWYGNNAGENPPWHVVAEHGTIPAGGDVVHLRGHVVVTHPTESGETLKILSPTLDVFTEKQVARTPDPVRILRGPSHVNAVGMVIEMKQNHMRLKSAVRGTYAH